MFCSTCVLQVNIRQVGLKPSAVSCPEQIPNPYRIEISKQVTIEKNRKGVESSYKRVKRQREPEGKRMEAKRWSGTVRPLMENRWKEQGVVISATWGLGLRSAQCLVVVGPEAAASTALIPLPWYYRHWPENPSMPARSSIHSALCNTETISQHSHSGTNKTSRWHQSVPEGITRLVSSFTSPLRWMSLRFTQRLCLL